jgi:hypothetical protein
MYLMATLVDPLLQGRLFVMETLLRATSCPQDEALQDDAQAAVLSPPLAKQLKASTGQFAYLASLLGNSDHETSNVLEVRAFLAEDKFAALDDDAHRDDALKWWALNAPKYPKVVKVANKC